MGSIIQNVSKINVEQKLQQACLSYLANYMGYEGVDEERQKLKEIFNAFDSNGDGHLVYEEIFEGYKQYFRGDDKRAELEARKILKKLDLNENGMIEYSEFLIANIDPTMIIREDRLREVFNMFDVDQSGAITVDEIKQILGGKANREPKQEDDINSFRPGSGGLDP